MKKIRYAIPLLLWSIMALGWACTKSPAERGVSPVPYLSQPAAPWIDSLLNTWSLEKKVGQLLLWEGRAQDTSFYAQAAVLAERGYLGGVLAEGYPLGDYLTLVDSLQAVAEVPLFMASRASVLFNEQLAGIPHLPGIDAIHAAGDDSLLLHLQQLFARQARFLGVNLVFAAMPNTLSGIDGDQLTYQRIPDLNRYRVITAIDHYDDFYPYLADTADLLDNLLTVPRQWVAQGVGGITVPPVVGENCGSGNAQLHTFIQKNLGFDGLLWANLAGEENLLCLFRSGYNAFRIKNDPEQWRQRIAQLVTSGKMTERELDESVRKVLRAKSWVYNGINERIDRQRPIRHIPLQASLLSAREAQDNFSGTEEPLQHHFSPRAWEVFREEVNRRAITLLHASGKDFPLNTAGVQLIDFGDQPSVHLEKRLSEYLPVQFQHGGVDLENGYQRPHSGRGRPVVVLGNIALRGSTDDAFMRWLREHNAVIINFDAAENIAPLDTTGITLLQTFGRSRDIEESVAEILVGARSVSGKLPFAINEQLPQHTGIPVKAVRLGYSRPEEVGIKGERLVSIDAIMAQAIRKRAIPGGQVLVAHQGRIIYQKAFGRHTYGGRAVKNSDVYDLASLTKTMATTLGIMHLYENRAITLTDRLGEHLPELAGGNLANITIERLLTHRSGIQPHMPVIPYLLHRGQENAVCDSFFCTQPSDIYSVPVAEDFYFKSTYQDSIWADLNEVQVRYGQRYRYSDVNFVLLQKIVERKTGLSLDQWANQYLYQPLGLNRTTFRPRERLSSQEIVPTEKDDKWRQQLVHGYVHDETAGLLGGVAGHAGLFSNARELAVLSQLLLNEGSYGGQQLFAPETIRLFRSAEHGNHRGLGFDKPHASNRKSRSADVSNATFGHTGFTGTCFWVDPRNELVFILLTNRVYPSARNKRFFRMEVRARVHQEVYDALGSFPVEWPSLPGVDVVPPPLLVQRNNPS